MGIKIISPKDAKEISIYLEKMNATNKSHIGFCGEQNEEIYDSLMTNIQIGSGHLCKRLCKERGWK